MGEKVISYFFESEPISIVVFFILLVFWVYDAINKYKKNGFSRGAYFSIITFVFGMFAFVGFIVFPVILKVGILQKPENEQAFMDITIGTIRWFFLYAVLCPLFFFSSNTSNRLKSGLTMFFHLSTLLVGWIFGEWFGLFFISIPIFVVFYWFLYHLAQAVFPAMDPESITEKRNKFRAFLWYIWGFQYPHWVAESSATRYSEKRIDGKHIKRLGQPGSIWTYSHQVVARSTGIALNRIDGPGIMFTGRAERPVVLVDLRTQLRPMPFTAVTKDGIEIGAFIFISFQIDRRDWSDWERERRYEIWRVNPILQGGMDVENSPYIGFPYSKARVHAALSASSIDFWENDDTEEERFWDEVAVQRVLGEARLVLSERNFNELWVSVEDDSRGTGAIDEISEEIRDRAEPELEKMGVQLFGSRIVNFMIEEDDPIYKQLKEAWLFKWNKKIAQIKFEGEAEAEKLKIEAKMASQRVFMETVSETLRQTQGIDSNVLRQLTMLNLIATLEKLIEDVDREVDIEQQTARISAWGRFTSRNSRDR